MNPTRRSAIKTTLVGGLLQARHAPNRDTIDLDAERQTIGNFGASDCWSMQKLGTWSLPNRQRVADLLFSQSTGIGLSCWRFNIGGGITDKINNPWRAAETFEVAEGKYDWSRQAPERSFLKAAHAAGVPEFLAFVNSPPGRMTRTGITYGEPEVGSTNLKPGFEGQFASYLVAILEHFRSAEGPKFDYISPVNEPNVEWNGASQEGCHTRIAGIEVAGLEPLYFTVERMSSQHGAKYGGYIKEFLDDKSVSGLLNNRLLYHDYGSDRFKGELVEHRQTLSEQISRYPGWRLWMSEYCDMTGSEGKGGGRRDLTMDTALDVARIIHLDLTLVGVTAWQWWTAVSPVDYTDEKARCVVAVYINMGTAPETVHPEFALGARRWRLESITPFVTSPREGDELKQYPGSAPGKPLEIPPRSVVSFVSQFTG